MTIGQKASLSLLISVVLFAGFTVLAYSGLFEAVQTRFYNPRVADSVTSGLKEIVRDSEAYHTLVSDRFRSILSKDYVRRSVLPNQSSEDIFSRSSAFGRLIEETPGLQGVRLLDADGKRIHFSTYDSDILRREAFRQVYRNYGDGDEPLESLIVPDGSPGAVRILGARTFSCMFSHLSILSTRIGAPRFSMSRSPGFRNTW